MAKASKIDQRVKALTVQEWWPGFNPGTKGRRKEPTPKVALRPPYVHALW